LEQGRKAKASYRNDDAVGYYSNILELQIEDGGRMEAFEGLGEVLEHIGLYDQALAKYQSVLELSPEADVSLRIHRKLGRIRLYAGEDEKAMESFDSAHGLLKDEKSVEAGKLRLAYAQALHRMRKWEESRKAANEAMEILELHAGQENEIGKVHSILGLSFIFGEPQEFHKAEEHLLRSLDFRRKAGRLDGEAATQNNLGVAYANLGKPRKALEHLRAGIGLAEETGSPYSASKLSMTTACVHYELLGEFDEALDRLMKALEIAEDSGDEYLQRLAHRHISRAQRFKGDLEAALKYSSVYLELAEKIGQKWDVANAHLERGKEFLVLKKPKDARISCKTGRQIAVKIGDKGLQADALRVEGSILRTEGALDESQKAIEEALRLLERREEVASRAMAYYEYALLWRDRGDRALAKENSDRAVELLKSDKAFWLAERVKRDFSSQ
jgi:tetratricopeptide (TPR) repeat protein